MYFAIEVYNCIVTIRSYGGGNFNRMSGKIYKFVIDFEIEINAVKCRIFAFNSESMPGVEW